MRHMETLQDKFIQKFECEKVYNIFDANEHPTKYMRQLSAFWNKLKAVGAVSKERAALFSSAKKTGDDTAMLVHIEAVLWDAGGYVLMPNYSSGWYYCVNEKQHEQARDIMERLEWEKGIGEDLDAPACV